MAQCYFNVHVSVLIVYVHMDQWAHTIEAWCRFPPSNRDSKLSSASPVSETPPPGRRGASWEQLYTGLPRFLISSHVDTLTRRKEQQEYYNYIGVHIK